ncbi:hypothetical protein BKA80DRAFT_93521 [Phyllosticta citrichinensis]
MMTAVNSLDLIHPGVAALVVALVRPQASAQHRNRLPLLPHGACHTTRSWSLGRSAVPGSAHPMLPRAPVPCRPCLFYPTLQGRLAAASFSEQRVLHGSFIRMLPPPPCPPNLLLSIHQHVNFAIRSVCFDAAVGTSATAVENNSRMLYAPRAKKPLRITENADRLTACAVAPTNPTPNQPGSRPDTRIPEHALARHAAPAPGTLLGAALDGNLDRQDMPWPSARHGSAPRLFFFLPSRSVDWQVLVLRSSIQENIQGLVLRQPKPSTFSSGCSPQSTGALPAAGPAATRATASSEAIWSSSALPGNTQGLGQKPWHTSPQPLSTC